MTAGLTTVATRGALKRRASLGNGWKIAAAVVLVPVALPILSLVVQLGRGGLTNTIPVTRLAELMASTLVLALAVTVSGLGIGFTTAWLSVRTNLIARRFWMLVAALPLVVPSYVAALTLIGATGSDGLIAKYLGITVPTPYGFVGSWMALSIFLAPMAHLILAPAMARLDAATEDAAIGLGASRRRVMYTVTIPQLRPALISAGLMISLYTISDFGAVSLLRFDTMTRAIYTLYQGQIDRRPAGTLALILGIVALVILWVERRAQDRASYHTARPARRARNVKLSPGQKMLSTGFLSIYAVISLALPVAVMIFWLARGLDAGVDVISVGSELARTLSVAIAAALVITIAALPLAMVSARATGPLAESARGLTWAAYSIPHIAVGVGIVAFALVAMRPLYQTVLLLIITYLAMFIAQASGSIEDSLKRANPDLEEASRGLGRGPVATFLRITAPLLTPGMIAGASLVFLSVMKELPATLLLRPNGFETLAVRIWSTTGEGFYTQASVAGLTLIAVSILPLLGVIKRDFSN